MTTCCRMIRNLSSRRGEYSQIVRPVAASQVSDFRFTTTNRWLFSRKMVVEFSLYSCTMGILIILYSGTWGQKVLAFRLDPSSSAASFERFKSQVRSLSSCWLKSCGKESSLEQNSHNSHLLPWSESHSVAI